MKKTKSLKKNIWAYLIVFSFLIILFLWLLQVLFINKYYEWYTKKELNTAAKEILYYYKKDNYEHEFDKISNEYGFCIEAYSNYENLYLSNDYNRGCSGDGSRLDTAKINFIKSQKNTIKYKLINQKYHNKTITYGIKIDGNSYIFISASLEPLSTTIKVLSEQLLIVTIAVIILSLIISYYISKKISKPIESINKNAKHLIDKDYKKPFTTDSNITEINELVDTLNDTKEELIKAETIRRELLANVTHDLKTPLTMIKAYALLIKDLNSKNPKKLEENLDIIINETERLNSLVNDILDLSSLEENATLNIKKINLNELLKEVTSQFDIYKINENYNIKLKLPRKKIYINADKKRISQVLYNFIINAIQHTGEDKLVEISLKDTQKEYKITVKDTGKGIKEEDLPYIWDRYYKIDKKYKRENNNTGLGLSIASKILKRHNFKYGVETSINNTIFYFCIEKEK